jgi:hypothetical protein
MHSTEYIELIEYLDQRFSQIPTKAYLDNKLAELEGRLTTNDLKSDYKITRLAEILKTKNVINESEFKELGDIKLVPQSQK